MNPSSLRCLLGVLAVVLCVSSIASAQASDGAAAADKEAAYLADIGKRADKHVAGLKLDDPKADAELRSKIANSFGSFDVWETEFRKIAQGLGGGSGWVVLGYNRTLRLLENYWMADHGTAPIDTTPLLVMDMYEHAYQMDYGAAAAKYIDTFLANVQWEAVAKRL